MATAIDPICKMEVDTENPPGGQSQYQGTTYYFCAPGCKVTFDKEPAMYRTADDGGHGHDHGDGHDHGGGHGHGGHHEGHQPPIAQPSRPGFFARLFGKK